MCVSDSDRRPTVIVYRVFSHNQTWPEPNERFCLSVNASEYGGGGLQISGYVCGGVAGRVSQTFLPLLGPQMGNLSFWRPPDDSFWVFYPPPDAISVILGSPDDSFRVLYPP